MSTNTYEETSRDFDAAKARSQAVPSGDDDLALDFLVTLDPLEYSRIRKTEAARLGVTVTALDQAVEGRRKHFDAAGSNVLKKALSGGLHLQDIEPASNPIDGARLLSLLIETLERYVAFSPHGALAVALWIIRAYAHDLFDVNPRLALISPEKRCGKTTLLEFIAHLVLRALLASNVTPATIFRIIEAAHPTLLIDEFDSFKVKDEELRGILNSGHRRAAAFVLRCVGEDHEPKAFSTWCPMVFAAIGNLPDTIQDRSIAIRMRRRAPNEKVQRLRWSGKPGEALRESLTALARACARWVADHADALQGADPAIPEGLNDRAADNWSGLLAIADTIGGDWSDRARSAAVALSGEREDESDSIMIELLNDVRTIFHESRTDRMPSKDVCQRLAGMEERPWGSWKRGHLITPAQLARLLRPFEIRSRDLWVNERGIKRCVKGYLVNEFADAFDRYLPAGMSPPASVEGDLSRETARPRAGSGDDADLRSARGNGSRVSENHTKLAPDADSRVLADEKGVSGEERGNGHLPARLADLSDLWRRVKPRFVTDGVLNDEKPSTHTRKRR